MMFRVIFVSCLALLALLFASFQNILVLCLITKFITDTLCHLSYTFGKHKTESLIYVDNSRKTQITVFLVADLKPRNMFFPIRYYSNKQRRDIVYLMLQNQRQNVRTCRTYNIITSPPDNILNI